MALDPGRRRELAKLGRLWLLSLVCAATGALVVARTERLGPGVLAFAICVLVLGGGLWAYERRR